MLGSIEQEMLVTCVQGEGTFDPGCDSAATVCAMTTLCANLIQQILIVAGASPHNRKTLDLMPQRRSQVAESYSLSILQQKNVRAIPVEKVCLRGNCRLNLHPVEDQRIETTGTHDCAALHKDVPFRVVQHVLDCIEHQEAEALLLAAWQRRCCESL
jgi:hypothetical protein